MAGGPAYHLPEDPEEWGKGGDDAAAPKPIVDAITLSAGKSDIGYCKPCDAIVKNALLRSVAHGYVSMVAIIDCMDEDMEAALFGSDDEDGEFEELNDDFILEAGKVRLEGIEAQSSRRKRVYAPHH